MAKSRVFKSAHTSISGVVQGVGNTSGEVRIEVGGAKEVLRVD
jgi:hypothetical protein